MAFADVISYPCDVDLIIVVQCNAILNMIESYGISDDICLLETDADVKPLIQIK